MTTSTVWPHGDPRAVARAIVTDPRYAQAPAPNPAQRSWLDVAHDWLVGLIRNLLHGIDGALGAHNPFEAAIGYAVVAAAFGLLIYASYRLVRSYARSGAHRVAADAVPNGTPAPQTSGALQAAALAAAHAGRFREAAALLFSAAVHALDERGSVAYDPARTPGEYRRLVRDPRFDALANDTVVALFAAAEPSGALFERMAGTYDRFLAARAP